MEFSLSNYITESLSSNILREIINEPSGFFKFIKIFYMRKNRINNNDRKLRNGHGVEVDIVNTMKGLNATISRLFNNTGDLNKSINNIIGNVKYDNYYGHTRV